MKFNRDETKSIGDSLDIDWKKYDIEEILMGMEVESEHGTKGNWNITDDDPEKTMKIALAHLDELPDYYSRLKKMEEEGKKKLSESNVRKHIKKMLKINED